MIIKKGQKLIGINPNSKEKEHYTYLGKNKDNPEFLKHGFGHKIYSSNDNVSFYVSNAWIKTYKVKPL